MNNPLKYTHFFPDHFSLEISVSCIEGCSFSFPVAFAYLLMGYRVRVSDASAYMEENLHRYYLLSDETIHSDDFVLVNEDGLLASFPVRAFSYNWELYNG